jgi:hypothetical protein
MTGTAVAVVAEVRKQLFHFKENLRQRHKTNYKIKIIFLEITERIYLQTKLCKKICSFAW